MLLTEDFLARWGAIVEQVEKDHVPIDVVKKVIFRSVDRRQRTINLQKLRNQGLDQESIELAVSNYITQHEDSILSMEFVLDIRLVADKVQPETDKLLRGI